MLFGLDAIPLTEPRAGVGHYTFELARALADLSPGDEFELAYPSTYPPVETRGDVQPPSEESAAALPRNLKFARVPVGPFGRHWWAVGLPRYASRRGFALFHGTNYEVPLWKPCARVVTVHDLSLLLLPETHEARRVRRARRRLPLMARAADACITPTESVRREVCERLGLAPSKVFAVPEAARAVFRPLASEACEAERRRLGVGEDFLLAVGTVEPRKNLSALVRAFEEVARARPASRLQLVVVGNRGWLSDPLFDGGASWMSQSAALLEIVAAVTLGWAGWRVLQARGGLASATTGPVAERSATAGLLHPVVRAMAVGNAVIFVLTLFGL